LEAKGHKVYAPDLPGHGSDKTPVNRITLGSYVQTVCRIIDAEHDPVVLVGHSRGGIVISQTAEVRARKVRQLVYLAAFLLQTGEQMIQRAVEDTDSLIPPHLTFSEDRSYHVIKDLEMLKEIFYGDCENADVREAVSRFVPEPTLPIETPLKLRRKLRPSIPILYRDSAR